MISCKRDSDSTTLSIEKVAIDSVNIARNTIAVSSSLQIITFAKYKQGCEGFYGYDYQTSDFQRDIIAYKYKTDTNCGTEAQVTSMINFTPKQAGIYTLRFWKTDNQWIEKNIIVTE
ncbi:MAG: hypothetical protein Q4C75_05775 [Bergeyella zoohelcum]|nr:hypothetical protein [Bergeyella zoohelcum]